MVLPLMAQRGGGGGGRRPDLSQYFGGSNDTYVPPDFHGNPAYDGRFTFARISYRGFAHMSREGPGWSHDYPDADVHLMRIMRDITIIRPFVEFGNIQGGVIVALDNPLLFKYPVAYLSEPGGWFPNDAEVKGMHNYLLKGGFVIFDDFGGGNDWNNWTIQMQRVLPGITPVELKGDEPIFDSFYKIDTKLIARQCAMNRQSCYRGIPVYVGYYENNDPKRRLLALGNFNADIGEFWQWSGQGFAPVDVSNEAYKLGINYLIYALTH
jgi:hypothetical protein